jgi:hypothetical protein
MKRILILFLLIQSAFAVHAQSENLQPLRSSEVSGLYDKLKELPNVDSIVKLPVINHFSEKYEIYYSQLLNPEDSAAGFFKQRIFLSHTDYTKPMIFVTEGYTADYAQPSYYSNELTNILQGNQIVVEHRYFGKSWPDSLNWEYLTVENAAHDHHELINAFKTIYTGKWISTGISKGGQTALFHMSLYPEDVDFSVPYVAPLNFALEDGRHEPFIDNISTEEDRKRVKDFQLLVLKKRKDLFPLFEEYGKKRNFTYRLPVEEIYDYCVLEYSFAFWQWGHPVSSIPVGTASDDKIFDHFMRVSSPSYFAIEDMKPTYSFFVQAYRQLGYYGYDTEPFKEYLVIDNAEGYLEKVFLDDQIKYNYDFESMKHVQKFIDENDPNMIFIYGEFDPWSATGVEFKDKENMFKITSKSGSHATRIYTLTVKQRSFVIEKMKEWLEE